jgi:Lrp/AsnC family transcriptional regulator of ectoine degradation
MSWAELRRHTAHDMQRFEQRMLQSPEVSQCYATGGGIDYLLIVRARDIDQYQAFMETLLDEDIGIERYYTYVVTKLVKDAGELPPESFLTDPE